MAPYSGLNLGVESFTDPSTPRMIADAAGDFFKQYQAAAENARKQEEHKRRIVEEYARPVSVDVATLPTPPAEGAAPAQDTSGLPQPPALPGQGAAPAPEEIAALQEQAKSIPSQELAAVSAGPEVAVKTVLDKSTHDSLRALFDQDAAAAADALKQKAKWTDEDISEYLRGNLTEAATEKLKNVPGGKITGLPGTKTREFALQRYVEAPAEQTRIKIAAKADDLAKRLAAKGAGDERKLMVQIMALEQKKALNSVLLSQNSQLLATVQDQTPEQVQRYIESNLLPGYVMMARSINMPPDSDVVKEYIADQFDDMADDALVANGGEAGRAAARKIRSAKDHAIKLLNADYKPPKAAPAAGGSSSSSTTGTSGGKKEVTKEQWAAIDKAVNDKNADPAAIAAAYAKAGFNVSVSQIAGRKRKK